MHVFPIIAEEGQKGKKGDDEKGKDIWDFDGADDVRTLKEVMDADKKLYYLLISIKKKV